MTDYVSCPVCQGRGMVTFGELEARRMQSTPAGGRPPVLQDWDLLHASDGDTRTAEQRLADLEAAHAHASR